MSRRPRIAVALVVLAIAAWWGLARSTPPSEPAASARPATGARAPADELRDALARARSRAARIPPAGRGASDLVAISGHVLDLRGNLPVGDVEVVYVGASGEHATTTGRDGAYALRVEPGTYRAFVRDDTVLSVGRPGLVRLPGAPPADTAGLPDESLMLMIDARADLDGVDLSIMRGGVVSGRVVDGALRPVAGAVVFAHGRGPRPTMASDTDETDRDGRFELKLPAGEYDLEASHPGFAGVAPERDTRLVVAAGDHLRPTVTLAAGCVISGRVIGRDGKPAGDGALERKWGDGALDFSPAGRIEADGRFRWATTDEADVTIRAWPWKSPPSPARQFTCRDGARFDDVVFQLPGQPADIAGVLVDRDGAAPGVAFIDLRPLDPGGINQQERTDSAGRWEVFSMPPGRYRITAQVEGKGVATATITAPATRVRLELGGTGRLEGTVAGMTTGSFELDVRACRDGTGIIGLMYPRRMVTVTGGRFAVDGLPACDLLFVTQWRGRAGFTQVRIPVDGVAQLALDLARNAAVPSAALAPEQDVPEQDLPEPDVPEPDVPEPDVPEPDVPQQAVPEP